MTKNAEEYVTDENKFMAQYRKDHECCPKCGATHHSTTLVAYMLDMNSSDNYKDRNSCKCMVCNDTHIMHDRVSADTVKDFAEKLIIGEAKKFIELHFDDIDYDFSDSSLPTTRDELIDAIDFQTAGWIIFEISHWGIKKKKE